MCGGAASHTVNLGPNLGRSVLPTVRCVGTMGTQRARVKNFLYILRSNEPRRVQRQQCYTTSCGRSCCKKITVHYLQGCRGYEISHPYPYPYPQIFCGYPWISMDIHIHGYPWIPISTDISAIYYYFLRHIHKIRHQFEKLNTVCLFTCLRLPLNKEYVISPGSSMKFVEMLRVFDKFSTSTN